MSAYLLIHDGTPWWNSPDIWVVPGNDPNGPPGSPIAGLPAYLWARVSNVGNVVAANTRIDFYWANPAAAVAVGTASFIGAAYTDLDPGETQDVLCLVPWIPVLVNGGHECVLAVAHCAGDSSPIPDPLPNGYNFDPPAHDQTAQLNLSVLLTAQLAMPQVMYVHAIGREDKRATLSVEWGKQLDERLMFNLGLKGFKAASERKVEASLSLEAHCGPCEAEHGKPRLELELKRGMTRAVFINLQARELAHDEYQLIHIVERVGETVTGGISFLVIHPHNSAEE